MRQKIKAFQQHIELGDMNEIPWKTHHVNSNIPCEDASGQHPNAR